MHAVIRRNKQLVCDEIADLRPDAGQVLVKTLACGICGSDLHALHHMEHMIDLTSRANGGMTGGFNPRADTVFGHEFCAEILDHGLDDHVGPAESVEREGRLDPRHGHLPLGLREPLPLDLLLVHADQAGLGNVDGFAPRSPGNEAPGRPPQQSSTRKATRALLASPSAAAALTRTFR
mgnify:CR=1 FL=1